MIARQPMFPRELLLPSRTISGTGSAESLIRECLAFGPRGLLVHGRSLAANGQLTQIMAAAQGSRDVLRWCHPGGEPTLDQLDELLRIARGHGPDWIAAIGGGSVMDIAKAAAGLLEAPCDVTDYHDGAPITPTRIAFAAAPTTAGTGSEATMVSVLTNATTGVKKSIRHPSMLARLVVLDPVLLESCPPATMAASGLDALTQAIESYTSRHATGLTDQLALQAVRQIVPALVPAYLGEGGYEAMLQGSYLAGLALSNARLGVVHGLAHPLGARFHLPHGLVCGVCLPAALAFNREAMDAKYQTLCDCVGGDILEWVTETMRTLGVENPFSGKRLEDEDAVVAEVLASGSTKANPRSVTDTDVHALLTGLFRNP